MKELSLKQCRPILLGILKYIDDFCRMNDISYSLGYGTLIGAVRHKGFIPWDDDIDVIMTRDNYERFIKLIVSDGGCNGRYKLLKGLDIANHLHAVVTDTNTVCYFPKNTTDSYFYKGGLWVDVFPLDGVDNEQKCEKIFSRIAFLRKLQIVSECGGVGMKSRKKRAVRNIVRPLLAPFSGLLSKLISRQMKGCVADANKDFVASFSVWYWKQKAMPAAWFDDYVKVKFEDGTFSCIKQYDKYLKLLYGNYMEWPPKEQRVPKHHYSANLIK